MVDGVTEGEESVGGQADPGQLGEEGVFLLGRQGFRHLVEVRLPCRPLGRRDVALDVPSTHKAKKRRQTTRQQVKNKKQTKDTKKKEKTAEQEIPIQRKKKKIEGGGKQEEERIVLGSRHEGRKRLLLYTLILSVSILLPLAPCLLSLVSLHPSRSVAFSRFALSLIRRVSSSLCPCLYLSPAHARHTDTRNGRVEEVLPFAPWCEKTKDVELLDKYSYVPGLRVFPADTHQTPKKNRQADGQTEKNTHTRRTHTDPETHTKTKHMERHT